MDLLPIGSIVNVKEVDGLDFMIVGFFPTNSEGNQKTYSAVRYPMGVYDNKMYFFFNNEDITKVVFEGYKNDGFEAMKILIDTSSLKDFK